MAQDTLVTPPFNPIQPGAYSSIDASQLSNSNPLARKPIVAILGTSLGGAPNKPLYFRGAGQLREALRGGPGYDCARFAFSGGASQVCFVRVGNSITQGTLALSGASGTPITLTSKDYGSWVNSIKVTIAAGNIITLTYTDQLGVAYTEKWDFSALSPTVQSIVDAINGNSYGFNGSNYVTATAGSGTLPLSTISAQPLAGGTDGTSPQGSDWTAGLQALETENVDLVGVATGDATVHAQVLTHVQNMSMPGARRERTTVVGGVLGESTSTVTNRIASLRDKRLQLAYPGIYDYDATGRLALWDPFYAAAKLLGMHAGLPDVATSLTHKIVPVVDVETKLSTVLGGPIDSLLLAGITPIAPAPQGGCWVVDSITGYNTDGTFRDFHTIRSADAVAVRVRTVLERQFVGGKNLLGTAGQIADVANRELGNLQTEEIIRAYQSAIVSPGSTPNVFNVSLPVMLVDTTKFIFLNVVLQPSSTVNTDVGFTAADALT